MEWLDSFNSRIRAIELHLHSEFDSRGDRNIILKSIFEFCKHEWGIK